jgi:LysM repeat protein
LFGGELEVETPLGVASVRGSFAVFTYDPGDPTDPTDDVLVLDCLEGDCGARGPNLNESLSNMERLVLGNNQTVLRFTLTGQDVQDFLNENPESQRVVATLTAAPPVNTHTSTLPPEASATPQSTATPTPVASSTPTLVIPTVVLPTATLLPPTATPINTVPPTTPILGTHTVRQGEALFCIGRGYGVVPQAIAALNGFTVNATLNVGSVLQIPAVRWINPPAGPVCGAQFTSPFAPTATPTANVAAPSATSGPTCAPNEFFDPVMNICRPISVPATNTPPPQR